MGEHESCAIPSMAVRELLTDEAAEALSLELLSGGDGLDKSINRPGSRSRAWPWPASWNTSIPAVIQILGKSEITVPRGARAGGAHHGSSPSSAGRAAAASWSPRAWSRRRSWSRRRRVSACRCCAPSCRPRRRHRQADRLPGGPPGAAGGDPRRAAGHLRPRRAAARRQRRRQERVRPGPGGPRPPAGLRRRGRDQAAGGPHRRAPAPN